MVEADSTMVDDFLMAVVSIIIILLRIIKEVEVDFKTFKGLMVEEPEVEVVALEVATEGVTTTTQAITLLNPMVKCIVRIVTETITRPTLVGSRLTTHLTLHMLLHPLIIQTTATT